MSSTPTADHPWKRKEYRLMGHHVHDDAKDVRLLYEYLDTVEYAVPGEDRIHTQEVWVKRYSAHYPKWLVDRTIDRSNSVCTGFHRQGLQEHCDPYYRPMQY